MQTDVRAPNTSQALILSSAIVTCSFEKAAFPIANERHFGALQVSTVALVGNGPLSARQREQIDAMSVVVRFNVPNGFLPATNERMTVWAVRHAAAAARRGYWGPEQLDDAASERLVGRAEVRMHVINVFS